MNLGRVSWYLIDCKQDSIGFVRKEQTKDSFQ